MPQVNHRPPDPGLIMRSETLAFFSRKKGNKAAGFAPDAPEIFKMRARPIFAATQVARKT